MRIRHVRFKNLNSLVGEWEIDLTHPAFASDGIFAITGPTGAGKTTILDAVCLALYGRTPRLSKVTKSGNEIMSRQTGECFSEVTFETQAGRFRCHWSQHRARKKHDGELQPPRHEIADADSGNIFEATLRGVADQIEMATGMDFDRFTRSMLLAQGDFAAFLQADPDERAPILEQITGTEIYSRISIRVHGLKSEERKKLDALQAELAGMQLLSEEDERQLKTSQAQKILQETGLNEQITLNNKAIAWLDGIIRIQNDLGMVEKQKQDWLTRNKVFQPEHEKLRRAIQAMELAGDYAALVLLRLEQKTDSQSLDDCLKELPRQDAAVKQAEEKWRLADKHLEERKAEQKGTLLVIRKARELDIKIREKKAPIKTAEDMIIELEKSLRDLQSRNDRDCEALRVKEQALREIVQSLSETSADETLVENLTGIRSRFEALQKLDNQILGKLDEINQADSQRQEAFQIWQEHSKNLGREKLALDYIQNTLNEKQAELQKVLGNRELADLHKNQLLLTEQKELLAKATEAAGSLLKSEKAVYELDHQKKILDAEELSLTSQMKGQSEKLVELETKRELLETQLALLKKIEDLEEARHQLQDGEQCPLCGSREHPFAEGNVPVPDETVRRLTNVRNELKSVTDLFSDYKVKLAKVAKDIEQVAYGRREHAGKIEEANRMIGEICSKLSPELEMTPSGPGLEEKLKELQDNNHKALAYTTRTLEAAETFEKELNIHRESREKVRESAEKAERETQTAAHKKDSAMQLLERLKNEAKILDEQQKKMLDDLRQDISGYGIELLSIDVLDQIKGQLIVRRDLWVERQNKKLDLDQQVSELKIQTENQAEQIRKSGPELRKQRIVLSDLKSEQEALGRDRHNLFGDRNPDHEEYRLSVAIEAAEKNLDGARDILNIANQGLDRLKNRIEELEKTMAARAGRLKSADEAFLFRLGASGFTDESCYRDACLPEDERKHLMEHARQLEKEQAELEGKIRDTIELLKTEHQKKITDQPREKLNQTLDHLVNSHNELQQEIGGITQKLKDNDSLRQKQQARATAIQAQKRECARWDMLHELIGSADGKKYRNFAQGLTFEIMIGHANRQLQKMTDRYLLIRDDTLPLELNVIDNYQAGEIRSTKNLSGGESFIVSLSLALGLSQMASKNVRIDSLFLDEGFGTLDEEALDMALETLAGLQQDGKLIGIISHVPALKERISAQIQVSHQTGGRSLISGPGCSRSHHRDSPPV